MNILALNAGSSTIKASLYQLDGVVAKGDEPHGMIWEAEGREHETLQELLAPLWSGEGAPLRSKGDVQAIVHRVVHGGILLRESARVTEKVRAQILAACELAPTHNAAALKLMSEAREIFGDTVPQVAVFDTAFHCTMPEVSYAYAGPYEWIAQGIRRFGFHGISHQYASERAATLVPRTSEKLRLVTCHLGSGCSLAAVLDGKSVDTTMGYTPLDGVPMERRSGAIDPGILVHLLRHRNYTVDSLDALLNNESGLAGLSGTGGDMRDVLRRVEVGDKRAILAIDVFVQRVRQGVASMAAAIGGIDGIVFTGGIGEHTPLVRQQVADGLGFLGVNVDADRNSAVGKADADISSTCASVRTWVIHSQENWMLARECVRVLGDARA